MESRGGAPRARLMPLLVACVVLAFFATTATASVSPMCHFALSKVDTLLKASFTKTRPGPTIGGACSVYLLNESETPGVVLPFGNGSVAVVPHGASIYALEEHRDLADPGLGCHLLTGLGSKAFWCLYKNRLAYTHNTVTFDVVGALVGSKYVLVQTFDQPRSLTDFENVVRYLAST